MVIHQIYPEIYPLTKAQIEALYQHIEAVEAMAAQDAERLDWIERNCQNGQVQIARSIMRTGYEVAVMRRKGRDTCGVRSGTLRQVIDSLMEPGKC